MMKVKITYDEKEKLKMPEIVEEISKLVTVNKISKECKHGNRHCIYINADT